MASIWVEFVVRNRKSASFAPLVAQLCLASRYLFFDRYEKELLKDQLGFGDWQLTAVPLGSQVLLGWVCSAVHGVGWDLRGCRGRSVCGERSDLRRLAVRLTQDRLLPDQTPHWAANLLRLT